MRWLIECAQRLRLAQRQRQVIILSDSVLLHNGDWIAEDSSDQVLLRPTASQHTFSKLSMHPAVVGGYPGVSAEMGECAYVWVLEPVAHSVYSEIHQ